MRNRMLALTAVALLVISIAWAGGSHKKDDPAAHAAKLQEKLGLTDAQTAEVRALIEDVHGRWAEIKASSQDEAARKAAKKELKAEYNTRMKSILNDEQWARYEEMRAEYKRKKQAKK